ncbi:hypothetical protein LSAT2_026718 [Lamellibrachia satsuma]|nr:hypothetical protein LSAT2_026718 [Lamellibrachia satsuma]
MEVSVVITLQALCPYAPTTLPRGLASTQLSVHRLSRIHTANRHLHTNDKDECFQSSTYSSINRRVKNTFCNW